MKVVYFGYLSDVAGTREASVSIENRQGVRVREIIDEKVIKLGEGSFIVLVNGNPATLDTLIKSGDTIKVLPHVGGG